MSWQKNSVRRRLGAALTIAALGAAACGPGTTSSSATPAVTTTTTPITTPASPATSTPTSVSLASTKTSSTPRVVIYNCEHNAVTAPSSFILTCADGGIDLENLRWTSWGAAIAHATGTLLENTCTPNCAEGKYVSYPASATVTKISGGHYTSMHVDAPQAPGAPYDFRLDTNGPA